MLWFVEMSCAGESVLGRLAVSSVTYGVVLGRGLEKLDCV
jgi:hypothetical protein